MSKKQQELPAEWVIGQVDDLIQIKNGYAFKSSDFQDDSGVPVIRQTNLNTRVVNFNKPKYLPLSFLEDYKNFQVIKGDVLIGLSGSIGNLSRYIDDEPALQNQRTGLLIELAKGSLKYVEYYLIFIKDQLLEKAKGVAVQNISSKTIENWPIPIAPLNQQKQIVAKIEELFSHIDAGIEGLKKVKALLKQYRQSVLKAAVTGELTKDWREQNASSIEPADQLLQRILTERRQRWEEQQLKQLEAKGKPPKNDKWKEKYKEPIEITNEDLLEIGKLILPDSWSLANIDQITSIVTDGEHATPPRTDVGIPLLSARNIQNGFISYKKVDYIAKSTHEKLQKRLHVMLGDVLLSCSGTVGRSCVVLSDPEFSLVRSVAVLRAIFIDSSYLSLAIRSGMLQEQIDRKKTQTAQANIFQGKIKTLLTPVPPLKEQKEIVQRVEEKLTAADRLMTELNTKLTQTQQQKQTILASAFKGELI